MTGSFTLDIYIPLRRMLQSQHPAGLCQEQQAEGEEQKEGLIDLTAAVGWFCTWEMAKHSNTR